MKGALLFSLLAVLSYGEATVVSTISKGNLRPVIISTEPLLGSSSNDPLNSDVGRLGYQSYRVYSDEDFQYRCIDRINAKRRLHETTRPLSTANYTKYTVERAETILRAIEERREIPKGRYALGESFFWYYDPQRHRTVDDAIQTWYSESRNYDYNRPVFSAKTGGFTQLVWKSSREVSCAKIDYETRDHYKTLLVCNFYPAGNVNGEFPYNVLPLRRNNKPDYDDPDYPSRPNRPNKPDRPDRPDRPERPNRPDRPDRPSRPDNDSRPPNRPDYDPRPPNRPDYDPRPPHRPDNDERPSRPGGKPRPPYDPDYPDNRPGNGYPTRPIQVSHLSEPVPRPASRPETVSMDSVVPQTILITHVPGSAQLAAVNQPQPTPVHYAPNTIVAQPPKLTGQVYEPIEAVLIVPQYPLPPGQSPQLVPVVPS